MEFRLIIAGTRTFNNYNFLKATCDHVLQNVVKDNYEIVIISGKAKGADTLGERYAKEKGYRVAEFPAEWDTYGKRAGYLRNNDMALYAKKADKYGCLAFWDGTSRGTKHMIDLCKKESIRCITKIY